jgi:hypothetical protein
MTELVVIKPSYARTCFRPDGLSSRPEGTTGRPYWTLRGRLAEQHEQEESYGIGGHYPQLP